VSKRKFKLSYLAPRVSCHIQSLPKCTYHVRMEASRSAYKRNIILNSVRQHNYFTTQGNYIGYMFRL